MIIERNGILLKQIENKKQTVVEQVSEVLSRVFGKTIKTASKSQLYKAFAITVRNEIMDKWVISNGKPVDKQVYYLSIEFLMGRALSNNILNIGKQKEYEDACKELGIDFDSMASSEPEAGLGNGGLGRLAACYMDSLSTLDLPAQGCGIRYEFGLFRQKIINGEQAEYPDAWLEDGSVWEISSPEEKVEVHFEGYIEESWEGSKLRFVHRDYKTVIAVPYDMPIVGYMNDRVNSLRLWKAVSPKKIDMASFNRGEYAKAVEEIEMAEVLSQILYPEDRHYEGKSLRLKQHYFFVSATMQMIISKFKKLGLPFKDLPDKVVVHINDTHPALAIPELMRILMDQEGLGWDEAWDITCRTFAFTNHTIMAEALEKWPEQLFRQILPRIYSIVKEINERFCRMLFDRYPQKRANIAGMALISYGQVAMAPLCIVGSFSVNGVSALHSSILRNVTFKDYADIYREKFTNVTNGVTHRRWLMLSNKKLSDLITATIGDEWIKDPIQLKKLEQYCDNAAFLDKFADIKKENKVKLAKYIKESTSITVDPDSIFDVHAKRLHEYKRQLMNILHIMYEYYSILSNPAGYAGKRPITYIFAAKAAPGYNRAKIIIKLINDVALIINNDKRINGLLKVVFMENYSVSLAQMIFPASDISEQISTASKEASGTGNMKFMLNGAVTIGTMDGANVEMFEAVGQDNIFIFGYGAKQVQKYYDEGGYDPNKFYNGDNMLKNIVDKLADGSLNPERPNLYVELYDSLLRCSDGMSDPYLILGDFRAYKKAHDDIENAYEDRRGWNRKAVINVANAGRFSSDISIANYNKDIWKLK
jgi:starch phosphorylase